MTETGFEPGSSQLLSQHPTTSPQKLSLWKETTSVEPTITRLHMSTAQNILIQYFSNTYESFSKQNLKFMPSCIVIYQAKPVGL